MILVDTGPLVAIVNADDQHHAECLAASKALPRPLSTVWPVLVEVMYLLSGWPRAQEAVWDMVTRASLEILPLSSDDVPRIRELMRQYANRPMDLADAALIRVAEREGIRRFFTIDRKDFAVYRLHGRIKPSIVP